MNTENQQTPTKEEIISFLKDQIEIKTLQAELQSLNSKIAKERAEELNALTFISKLTQQPPEETDEAPVPHTITKEDLINNPELSTEHGLKEGDEVLIPKQEKPEGGGKRTLRK